MFIELEHATLLAPLLAYLLARAVASALSRRYPGSPAATLVAFGAGTAALMTALFGERWSIGDPYWLAADAAGAAALFAAGAGTGSSRRRSREESSGAAAPVRALAGYAIPAAIAFTLAIGFGAANGSGLLAVTRTALALAAALWLSSDSSGPGILAAGVALCLASDFSAAAPWAVAAAAGFAAALLAVGAIAKTGGPVRVMRSAAPALAFSLAWALRAAGLSWPAAGLAAGLAYGLGRRFSDGAPSRTTPARMSGTLANAAAAESACALAFIAGLGISFTRIAGSATSILVIAGSMLASAALRTLASGSRFPYFPTEAAAFAALIAAKQAGLASDATLTGAALAFVAAMPLSRLGMRVIGDSRTLAGIKAIVGISPKGSPLGALSFAAAIGESGAPIRVACVAAADGTTGASPAEAEETLVRCVAAGASAEIRVLPSVVVSASVPDGLARAALERRADAVVLGLGSRSRSSGKKAKTALEGMLTAFPGSVIAIRNPETFSTARRLVAMAVAGTEDSPGFLPALQATARAWGRPVGMMETMMIGAPASVLVDAARGMLDERLSGSVASWRDVPAAIDAQASRSAAFVVFSSRPGDAAWNPGHERLPVVLDAAFPDSPLALWFLPRPPSETSTGDESAERQGKNPDDSRSGAAGSDAPRWPPIVAAAWASGRIVTGMKEAALVDAIRRLTDAVFPKDRGASGRLAAEFSAVARKEPIELAPGVLLLHAHARGLSLPTLAIGARPGGWPLVALSSPVKIAVALVSPEDSGPEVHLEALTQIAAAFRNLGLADRLLQDPPPDPSTGRNETIA